MKLSEIMYAERDRSNIFSYTSRVHAVHHLPASHSDAPNDDRSTVVKLRRVGCSVVCSLFHASFSQLAVSSSAPFNFHTSHICCHAVVEFHCIPCVLAEPDEMLMDTFSGW